jgi:CRP-like cAMP-binding protein
METVKYWYLRNHTIFDALSDEDYKQLEWLVAFKTCTKHEFIYFPEDEVRKVYFVKRGNVKLGYYDDDGNEILLDVLKENDIFGQISLDESNDKHGFAMAMGNDTVLCNFNVSEFEAMLKTRPTLAVNYSKQVGKQQMTVSRRYSSLLFKDARTRLIQFFKEWADAEAKGVTQNIVLKNYLTQQEIAALNGLARQTTARILGELKEQNLIDVRRREVLIPSINLLK